MKKVLRARILMSWLLLLISCCLADFSFAARAKEKGDYSSDSQYFGVSIEEVLSGDMLRLDNGEVLRLIAIDTPEVIEGNKLQFDSKVSNIPIEVLRVMGNEAKSLVEKLLKDKRVRVEFDKKRKDNYGNLLGYLFALPEKKSQRELFINAEIIKNGYTYEIDSSPNRRYLSLFKKLHEAAGKSQDSQLWKQWRR